MTACRCTWVPADLFAGDEDNGTYHVNRKMEIDLCSAFTRDLVHSVTDLDHDQYEGFERVLERCRLNRVALAAIKNA